MPQQYSLTPKPRAIAAPEDSIDQSILAHPRAIVDWIDIRLKFASPSQARHIHDAWKDRGVSHVQAIDSATETEVPARDLKGKTTDTFVLRIQNPESPAKVRELINEIAARRPLAAVPICVSIEVSVLMRLAAPPIDHDEHRAELARVGELVYRNMGKPVSQDHRILMPKPDKSDPADPNWHTLSRDDNRLQLRNGHTIYIGHTRDEASQRIYVSTSDDMKGGVRQPLPPDEWAVKFETILRGHAMPFRTLDEWATFKFQDLSRPYFAIRKPKPGVPVAQHACFNRTQRPTFTRQKFHPDTDADTVTTERIRIALRGLSERQQTGFKIKTHNTNSDLLTPAFVAQSPSLSAPNMTPSVIEETQPSGIALFDPADASCVTASNNFIPTPSDTPPDTHPHHPTRDDTESSKMTKKKINPSR